MTAGPARAEGPPGGGGDEAVELLVQLVEMAEGLGWEGVGLAVAAVALAVALRWLFGIRVRPRAVLGALRQALQRWRAGRGRRGGGSEPPTSGLLGLLLVAGLLAGCGLGSLAMDGATGMSRAERCAFYRASLAGVELMLDAARGRGASAVEQAERDRWAALAAAVCGPRVPPDMGDP